MTLVLIPLPDKQRLKKINDAGFSLLEVIVALTIMAIGFVTVSQLFSGSIRSITLSEQYLKGTTLAHSKLGELEVSNYSTPVFEGTFPNQKKYRWKLQIKPHISLLNNKEKNIQLSEVTLTVLWEDKGKNHDIELNTIKVDGELHPGADSLLAKSFGGGPGFIQASENEDPSTNDPSQNISGRSNKYKQYISGASTNHISGN
jgi:general secretion pathway protein I